MTKIMKPTYRLYQRAKTGVYYIEHNQTREQRSLQTTDKAFAKKLLAAENQAKESAAMNLELGKVYISHADPKMATRTWQEAIDAICKHGKDVTQKRYSREMKSLAYDIIRNKPIIQTTSEDLKAVLKRGGSATNNFLRRLHNLALDNGWIRWHIIMPKQWDKTESKVKRAITLEEHQKIISAEQNEERRHYYEMLWHIGAAQTDGANITAEKLDWQTRVLSYQRRKTGEWCHLSIGSKLEALLKKLPSEGFLFPHIAEKTSEKDRAAEFCRRCRILEIKGVSLHSYRYAWAERAYSSGYEMRFAQAALGHKNRSVHHAYAKRAVVVCPPLEDSISAIQSSELETSDFEVRTLAA